MSETMYTTSMFPALCHPTRLSRSLSSMSGMTVYRPKGTMTPDRGFDANASNSFSGTGHVLRAR